MLTKIFNKLANTLLFYVDKSGKSVFRNYCLLEKDGYAYDETFSIQIAGKALEYRMELDKKLNIAIILVTILTYLIFINLNFSIWSVLLCEFIWCILFFGCRYVCSEIFGNFMRTNFGKYKVTNFRPAISKERAQTFKVNLRNKIALIFCLILLFFVPAFFTEQLIKISVNAKKPHYKIAIGLTKFYTSIYPKFDKIYDMSAYAKYLNEDYEGAISDYEKIFVMTGKKFKQKDFNRFANFLYLQKKLYGSQTAIEKFNDYITRKKLSPLEESQILWIKSIFSISNNVNEYVMQDYDDLLVSLKENDNKNKFYISSDKAYMMFLMRDYKNALSIYDYLVSFANQHKEEFGKDLPRLYVERGYTKRALGDNIGADSDFLDSGIDMYNIEEYMPTLKQQGFAVSKF